VHARIVFTSWGCAVAISSISGCTTNPFQSQTNQANFRQTFNQLVSALNSGDLSTAQQAFSALSQLQSNGQGPSANSNSPLAKALSQIGQALQSGDLAGAQQALSTLQQAHQGHHHGHHGHHGGDGSSTSSQIVQGGSSSDANGSSSSSNAVDVTA
jgi:outer membrane protein assembly factor BamD (BamD/ComL family)